MGVQTLLLALVVPASGTLKVVAPDLDDGDLSIGTWALPDLYKCDACRAVAHQVAAAFADLKPKPAKTGALVRPRGKGSAAVYRDIMVRRGGAIAIASGDGPADEMFAEDDSVYQVI